MKKIAISLAIALLTTANTQAQTYLESIQKEVPGQGTVTVIESKEIDDLVNGKQAEKDDVAGKTTANVQKKKDNAESAAASKETGTARQTNLTHQTDGDAAATDGAGTAVDSSRKIMRGTYKIDGFRVQAFSGGNSRDDKNKAYEAGDAIKKRYPNIPVYVHFFSPRWTCRIGNFRSYEEASQMLSEIKSMGFDGACIVKGKITVQ